MIHNYVRGPQNDIHRHNMHGVQYENHVLISMQV